jgi:ribosome biogenesis protein MAK21
MLSTPDDNAYDSGDEHYEDVAEEASATKEDGTSKHARYDARKRDPEYAHADLSCLWELLPLQAHYHPSVNVLASRLLHSEPIKEKPDPTLYTLMNFLDKFAFRNAKSKPNAAHGTSIMQPMSGTSKAADYLITSREGDKLHDPVNSEQFWKQKVDDVREDEVFFHMYFEKTGKARQATKKDKKKAKKAKDDESESGEEEIWKALVNSRPDIEGEDDDDEGFSDFDMDDMSDGDAADVDGGVELNLGSDDEEALAGAELDEDEDEDMGDDGFDLDDEDAIVDSDDDIPVDIDMDDDTDVEEPAVPTAKTDAKKTSKEKRKEKKKLKSLPTFASADDYAKLLGGDDSE